MVSESERGLMDESYPGKLDRAALEQRSLRKLRRGEEGVRPAASRSHGKL